MAAENRYRTRDLIDELSRHPERFGLFQALRVLANGRGQPSTAALPESLRFRTPANLAFPPAEITHFSGKEKDAAPDATQEMVVACMGLTGPSGALPTPYTELLIERQYQYRDHTAHAFFDLFSHRALSLFYTAWRKYHFPLSFEQLQGRDVFTRSLRSFIGLGWHTDQPKREAPAPAPEGNPPRPLKEKLLFFAGLLAQRPVSATAIAELVEGLFQVPARLENFVGTWITVPEEQQSRLGANACTLGSSAFAGQRIWDRQTRVRLHLGPLSKSQYQNFCPDNPGALELKELLAFCVGHGLGCDIKLTLKGSEVAPLQLPGPSQPAPRLGLDSWLTQDPFPHHPSDAAFMLLA